VLYRFTLGRIEGIEINGKIQGRLLKK